MACASVQSKSSASRKPLFDKLFIIFLVMILTFVKEQIMIGLIINAYVFASLLYFFKNRGALKDMFQWKSEVDEEAGEIHNEQN